MLKERKVFAPHCCKEQILQELLSTDGFVNLLEDTLRLLPGDPFIEDSSWLVCTKLVERLEIFSYLLSMHPDSFPGKLNNATTSTCCPTHSCAFPHHFSYCKKPGLGKEVGLSHKSSKSSLTAWLQTEFASMWLNPTPKQQTPKSICVFQAFSLSGYFLLHHSLLTSNSSSFPKNMLQTCFTEAPWAAAKYPYIYTICHFAYSIPVAKP